MLCTAAAAAAVTESGDSDSDEAGKSSQARREPVPALDELDGSRQQQEDEVERVLGHRWEEQALQAVCCWNSLTVE
jgi:hypothetical protein